MSLIDGLITELDRGLKTIFGLSQSGSNDWLNATKEGDLSTKEKQHAAGLMRVNHVGEVCAQALYYGQSFVTKDVEVKAFLLKAAEEEAAHLNWCKTRLNELDSNVSLLNPLWYSASFLIGVCAGLADKQSSLGFVMATEKQVEQHLRKHLVDLPINDFRSRAIVGQMIIDEVDHANHAQDLGGVNLPVELQAAMRYTAKFMTSVAYWL